MDATLNPLEQALQRAATDPAARPAFYRALLDAEVFVIGRSQYADDGSGTLPAGSQLSLAHWRKNDDTLFVPFFSSLERLRATQHEEARFVALRAGDLFEISRGTALVLNPGSDLGKEFFPEEIEALLDTGVNHVAERHVVDEARNVLLGQPAEMPTAMLDAVRKLLVGHAGVRAAYLARMDDLARPPPALVIGLEGDDLETAMRETGAVAADTAPADTPVDLVEVRRGDGGLGDWMLQSVEPFYRRPGFGAKLRSLFGG